jgi:phage terminase large subunit-like protein
VNLSQALVAHNTRGEEERAIALVREQLAARDLYKIGKYFHDCLPGCKPKSLNRKDHVPLPGNLLPTCRVLYIKHLLFIAAGLTHQERLFLAANRIGKTDVAAYEIASHLSGRYPHWWHGRRFDKPTKWWAAGDTRQTTRDVVQTALLGRHEGIPTKEYSGMIEPRLIVNVVRASGGVANCVDTIYIEHVNKDANGAPLLSELGFKSYDQGRRTFQGTEKDGIWLDEEPPAPQELSEAQAQGSSEVYTECLLRLLTTKGLLISTFTPLKGYTPFLRGYTETSVMPGTGGADVDAKTHFFPDQLGQTDTSASVDA